MPIDKLIPRYLNKDDDYLLVKSVEMVDALNIQTADDEGGNAGVVKNALGNVLVSANTSGDVLPAFGANIVIGATSCKQTGEIFYFVYNGLGDHSIYQYTSKRNTVRLVYRDSVLNFTATGFIKADCLVKENGDTLLYFTDGITDPKKINATKALANTSGSLGYPYRQVGLSGYTSDEKLLSITTIKAPPLEAPTVEVTTVTGIISNNITKKNFQFAYQYIYEDGEVSAISPYSQLAVDIEDFLDGFGDFESDSVRNAINVTYNHSRGDVSKIRILYRQGNLNNFSIFKELANDRSLTTGVAVFTNSTIGQIISDNEINKQYDAVPLSAKSQVISGNRLTFGNYKEFYDNTNVSSQIFLDYNQNSDKKISVTSLNFVNTSGTLVSANTSGTNGLEFSIDLTQMPDSSASDINSILNFSIFIDKFSIIKLSGTFNVGSFTVAASGSEKTLSLGNTVANINKKAILPAYASKATLASSVISQVNGDYLFKINPTSFTSGSINAVSPQPSSLNCIVFFGGSMDATVSGISVSGNVITFRIIPKPNGLNLNSAKIVKYESYFDPYINTNVSTAVDVTNTRPVISWKGQTILNSYNLLFNGFRLTNLNKSFFIVGNSFSSFKSGQNHKFGIVYYDSYNRSSAVNEIGEIYNPTEGERLESYGAAALGSTKAIIRLQSSPPSWAKKWRLVYSPYQTYSFCYTYSAAEAFVSKESISTGSVLNRAIYVSARHLEGKSISYKESNNALINYQHAEGDKLRIISYVTASGSISYPKQFVYDIIGYEYYDLTNTPVSLSTGSTSYSERSTGLFFALKDEDYTNFNADSILNNYSLWSSDVIFEIFRPTQNTSSSIYKETNVYGDVDLSGSIYYHKSETRDRRYSYTSFKIQVSSGTAYTSGDVKLYPGDSIQLETFPSGPFPPPIIVKDTYVVSGGVRVILYDSTAVVADGTYLIYGISNINDSILEAKEGDCYYRPRQIKLNQYTSSANTIPNPANVSGIRYADYYVEDTSISDFYVSNNLSLGRPNVSSSNAKQIERKSSVTYSEPYSLDTSVLKLSSFNGGQGNFVDLPNAYGAINYMINNGDTITVLQEVKSSVIPINRNLVEYADGSTNVTISTNYLGNQSVYAGDYGTQNPESVMFYKGRVYFADVRSGKIVRIGGDGIEPISENKVDAYTQDKCFIIASASGVYKVIGGIDPMHNEYLVTYTNVSGGTNIKDTIAYDTDDKVWNTRYSFIPEAYENMDNYMYTFKDGLMYRHTDAATRNSFYGSGTTSNLTLISAFNNSMVKVAEALSIEGNKPWNFKFTTSGTTSQETVTVSGSSMVLKEGAYYLNVPMSISASTTSNRAVIGYVSATGTWASGATITLGNPIVAPFQASGNTAILCLDASGNTVSTLTNYKKIEQVDRNTIQLSNVSGATPSIATGTILVVDSNASVDGDPIRGPYFLIELSNSDIVPIEAYAFNVYFSRSKLHNELVTQ
jgi:hypothetical protein